GSRGSLLRAGSGQGVARGRGAGDRSRGRSGAGGRREKARESRKEEEKGRRRSASLVGLLRLVRFGGWRGVRFRLARFGVGRLRFTLGFGGLGLGGLGPGGLGLGWLIGFVGFYGFGLAGFGLGLFLVALARALGRARALARRRRSAERFQIGGDDGRRFAAGRVMLTQEAGQAERAAGLAQG